VGKYGYEEGFSYFVYFECRVFQKAYPGATCGGRLAFTRYFFTSRLYCTTIFFANTPFIVQYIAQYYQLLHPPPDFEVCFRCLEVFGGIFLLALVVGFWMGGGVWKKIVLDTEKGKGGIIAYYWIIIIIIVQYPLPAPLYCLQYCAIYFPHDPLYCNKILAISCKGQVIEGMCVGSRVRGMSLIRILINNN